MSWLVMFWLAPLPPGRVLALAIASAKFSRVTQLGKRMLGVPSSSLTFPRALP